MRALTVHRPQTRLKPQGLPFGRVFTDHMLAAEHSDGPGWGAPAVRPFARLSLHPATQVLHYGMSCFEGMKAFAGVDGRGRLFRRVPPPAAAAASPSTLHAAASRSSLCRRLTAAAAASRRSFRLACARAGRTCTSRGCAAPRRASASPILTAAS
jgi:hypothetical protein